jgi:hypothetical protein
MTTPDQQYDPVEPTDRSRASTTEVLESSEAPGTAETSNSREPTGSVADRTAAHEADGTAHEAPDTSAAGTESCPAESLFAEKELSGLRSQWTHIQSGFVDDPRECVQKADGLVSDVVDRLTAGFAEARSRLEAQWARGEEISTEDLRLAMKRYREFFERLLAF